MEKVNRRNFLKAAGGATALGVAGSYLHSEDDFSDVVKAVDERKKHIEEHPGKSIHFDDPNKLLDSKSLGDIGPHFIVEEELEDKSVEEIAENLPGQTELTRNDQWYDFLEEQELNMRIVHLDEGNYDINLTNYVEETTAAFEDLLPSRYDVNVQGEVVQPDQDDLAFLKNPEKSFGSLDLSLKYTEDGELPAFLTPNNVKDHSAGHANLMENASFVELNDSEESNISTTIHEFGHLRLFLPHNYREEGVMSYNSEADLDHRFNSNSKLLMDAVTDGEVNYSKRMIKANNLANPDEGEYEAPIIDVEYEPASIGTEAAEDYVAANVDAFVNQYIDANADEVNIGEEGTTVTYRGRENDLEILLDGDVKDAQVI